MSDERAWKGIVLAGGQGTRLYPMTLTCSKQLLPIYDKPMIYYPICTLMLGGVREMLIISTPKDLPHFEALLGDGSRIGISFSYAEQSEPKGIAEALIIGGEFVDESPVCLILGDNLFYGDGNFLRAAMKGNQGATIFGYAVGNPERYGIIKFDDEGNVVDIVEKPQQPIGHHAVPGLYCYDNRATTFARQLRPSPRGEVEITDLNKMYLDINDLTVNLLGRGMAWLDTGTPESLLQASAFVSTIEHRQGLKIGCLEEAAFRAGFISRQQLAELGAELGTSGYGEYVSSIAREAK